MTANRVIGVDLGGTKVRAGVVDENGAVLATIERPTITTSQSALLDELADVVHALPQEGVRAVGFGIPTRVDVENGRAVGAAVNIPVRDVAFRAEMQERLGLPIEIENDASCAAYAEFVFGAGHGSRDFV
ncbi:MAG: ROK family protein, partial [Gaiellaceae bacterium]